MDIEALGTYIHDDDAIERGARALSIGLLRTYLSGSLVHLVLPNW